MIEIEIKYQTINLCKALLKNINDNFESVSFNLLDSGHVQTKIILFQITEKERDYIEDLMAEFSAIQEIDCVLKVDVVVGESTPLKNIVYQLVPSDKGGYS